LVTGVGEALSFVGTEGFIAPEGPGTPQADIYSLGIVLYVLSTGKSHQDFPEPLADLRAQQNHAQWLEFDAVLHKACRTNLRERFQSAEAMHAELALLQSGRSVRRKRAVQRRWLVAKNLAIGLMAVALAFLTLPWLRGTKHPHIPNAQAVKLYELGDFHYNQLTPEDHEKAEKFLTEAVRLDPKFAAPYGDLIGVYAWAMLPGLVSDQERLQKTREIAQKLLAIGPNLAESHTALSYCHFLQRDWREAEREILLAIKANPDYAFAHEAYCFYLTNQGRTSEAEREGQRAQALEPPTSGRISAIFAVFPFIAERRFDRAIAQLKQVLELDWKFAQGHSYLGDCYEAQSNYVAAIEEYRAFALLSHQDPARFGPMFDGLRQACEAGGRQGYCRKWIELMVADEALPPDQQLFADRSQTALAGYYAWLGEKEKALTDLEKHFDEANVWDQIKFFQMYDSLYDEPRFKVLLKRARLEP
jgi:hypothetical protein